MILKLSENLLTINGLVVYQSGDDPNWYACNGSKIGLFRLQALYLFLHQEVKAKEKRFYKYVDRVILKLIGN